ncbi:uncharacterized protein LOC111582099 [Tachysurus ichikawai]
MITALLILALCLFSGQVDGSGVLQNPDIIWGSPGSSAEMNCTHNKDINHRQMYWFKQLPGEGITLLVFTSVGVKTDYGKFTEDKYVAVKTVFESGSLTVKNLEPGDDALYFCASKEITKAVKEKKKALWHIACRMFHSSSVKKFCEEVLVTLTCNHSINNYDTILWYQRTHGDTGLKLIGYASYSSTKKIEDNYDGQVDGSGVLQNPDIIWGSPGSSAEMNCTHNKNVDHRQMYWFKQLPGEGITLLVFTSVGVKTDYGKFTEDKYVAVKTEVESGSLTVKNLEPGDAALYFCAVSKHCGANSLHYCTNTKFPAVLFLQPGDSLNITCSHHDKNYDKIYWYQHVNQQSLQLIGFLNFKNPETDIKGFNISGDAEKEGYLSTQSVTADYSALYFCAIYISLFSIATVISSLNIQQLPQNLLITPEQREVKLSCQHGDSSYIYMYWYQQKTVSDSIELIGMLQYQRFTPEEKFKPRFNISGHATGDAFLLISSVAPEDSAVYFCAAIISSLNIQQLPQHLITPEQSEAKLSCRHGDISYSYMYWYKQKKVSDSIELIGVLVSQNPTLEEKFKTKFSISGQSTGDAFLLISSVTLEDSAVYFCAASKHSHTPSLSV